MKISYFLIVISLILECCSVKHKILHYSYLSDKRIPKIDFNFEKFDLSIFNVNKIDTFKTNTDTIFRQYNNNFYSETNSHGEEIKLCSKFSALGEVVEYDYTQSPIIGVYKVFFANGNIQFKGLKCWFGCNIGCWYYFSTDGKLIKTVDYDNGYILNIENVMQFCKTNNIPLLKVDNDKKTSINRGKYPNGKLVWYVEYPNTSLGQYVLFIIDDANDKVIKKSYRRFEGE